MSSEQKMAGEEAREELVTTLELSVGEECPVKAVEVFTDRAEVTRQIALTSLVEAAGHTGEYRLTVSGISLKADPDSVRVSGIGPVMILEVGSEKRYVKEDESARSERERKQRELQEQLDSLQCDVDAKSTAIERVRTQQAMLASYSKAMLSAGGSNAAGAAGGAATVSYPAGTPPACAAVGSAADGGLTFVSQLLTFHEEHSSAFDTKIAELSSDVRALHTQMAEVRAEMDEICSSGGLTGRRNAARGQHRRDVTLGLQVTALDADITLDLKYIVSDASWAPSYDVRVDGEPETVLTLAYFGEVRQNTGEDWSDCEISLSTATPSVGGTPPKVPHRQVIWKRPEIEHTFEGEESFRFGRIAGGGGGRGRRSRTSRMDRAMISTTSNMNVAFAAEMGGEALEDRGMEQEDFEEESEDDGEAAHVQASVKKGGGAGASTFIIPTRTTVASDNKPHKVTVTTLTLKPSLMHFIVPSEAAHAYLQASATNDSDYPILASSKVSVFFEGSFVTKTTLPQVSAGESFLVGLGVDPSVNVDYPPRKETTRGQWAMRGKLSQTTFEQCAVVTCNKSVPVLVSVVEVIPRSTDEQIKVELETPAASELADPTELQQQSGDQDAARAMGDGGDARVVTRNPVSNNLIWKVTIQPGARERFPVRYSVSHPQDQPIEIA